MNKAMLLGTAGVAVLTSLVGTASAGFLSGEDANATLDGEARARNMGAATNGFDYDLSIPPSVPRTIQRDVGSNPYNATNTFSLSWDGASTVEWIVNGESLKITDYVPTGTVNYLRMSVVDRGKDINGVFLDNIDLTSLTLNGDDVLVADGTNWQNWYIADNALSSGFTISGIFTISGDLSGVGQETSKLGFAWGNSDLATMIPLPTGSAMAGVGLLVVGTRRRRA
jgi:hypothetical protein